MVSLNTACMLSADSLDCSRSTSGGLGLRDGHLLILAGARAMLLVPSPANQGRATCHQMGRASRSLNDPCLAMPHRCCSCNGWPQTTIGPLAWGRTFMLALKTRPAGFPLRCIWCSGASTAATGWDWSPEGQANALPQRYRPVARWWM
jgi:hypothetical protein